MHLALCLWKIRFDRRSVLLTIFLYYFADDIWVRGFTLQKYLRDIRDLRVEGIEIMVAEILVVRQ